MTRDELLKHGTELSRSFWLDFAKLYPRDITSHNVPRVTLNNRLKTTAGRAHYDLHMVEYSTEIFEENFAEFASSIIPHELGHLVAYRVFGDVYHGKGWHTVMQKLGLPYSRLHNFSTIRMRQKRK